jgi:hypothetical protein
MHDGHDHRVEVEPLLRQDIFIAFRRFLIRNPAQHAEPHQFFQAFGQEVPGNPERGLKRFEPALAQKTLPENEQAPAIADHGDRAGQRTGFFFQGIPFHRILQSTAAAPSVRTIQASVSF